MAKFNLHLAGSPDSGNKLFTWSIGGEPRLVAGPYKMVSIFFRMLLTSKGSIVGRASEGTDFLTLLDGNFADSTELQDKLVEIFEDCFYQVRTVQQRNTTAGASTPSNELLVSYRIAEFFVSSTGESAVVKLELKNADGDVVSGLIPVV